MAIPICLVFFKVIACEVAFREICHAAARSPSVLDLEFLTQGYHDHPNTGRSVIQERLDAVPPGKYDAILIGYGLCSSILRGLTARGTQLVAPRAHDCIALFLGSKERYQRMFDDRPGTYYYTSGWLECVRRRGLGTSLGHAAFLPTQAGLDAQQSFASWVQKYGLEQAQYLFEVTKSWSAHYSHGVLIDFDFTQPLALEEHVQQICAERGWRYEKVAGDLRLLQRWLDGDWTENDFLIVPPGRQITPSYDESIIALAPEPSPVRS